MENLNGYGCESFPHSPPLSSPLAVKAPPAHRFGVTGDLTQRAVYMLMHLIFGVVTMGLATIYWHSFIAVSHPVAPALPPRARASPAIAARGRLLARLRSRRASAPQHTAFLLTILTASIYNAAGYYFTVFSQRYEKGVDEQIKQAQLEPPKGC